MSVGAKVLVNRGRGLVVALICNDDTCGGGKKRNDLVFVTHRFPVFDYFSEMQQKITIPADGDQKNYLVRIFCEDGSECDIDYLQLEDAWGTDRMLNSQFATAQSMTDPRKQPSGWLVDITANLYGSVDPSQGNKGALMINNSAE